MWMRVPMSNHISWFTCLAYHVHASSTRGWIFVYFIEYSSTVSLFQAKDVQSKCKGSGAIAVLRSTSYCYFSRDCTIRLKCFPYFWGLFFMRYLCEKCYKPINSTVLCSWLYKLGTQANFVARMNKLDLWTHSQNGICSYVGDLL